MAYTIFYDQVLNELLGGSYQSGINLLVGMLDVVSRDEAALEAALSALQTHDLFQLLVQDPLCAPDIGQDGQKIADLMCSQLLDRVITSTAQKLFEVTSNLTFSRAIRQRRVVTGTRLARAWQSGKRICVVGHGQIQALEQVRGQDLSNITCVANDATQIDFLQKHFGPSLNVACGSPSQFFKSAVEQRVGFDLVCFGDVADEVDHAALQELVQVAGASLTDAGSLSLASIVKSHLGLGWRRVCLGWAVNCHDEAELQAIGVDAGLAVTTSSDVTNCVIWSEFTKTYEINRGGINHHGY